MFAKGRGKTGGGKKGVPKKRTVVAAPKIYPDGLDHLAMVVAASDDPTITPN
jgi:hypothetical protein